MKKKKYQRHFKWMAVFSVLVLTFSAADLVMEKQLKGHPRQEIEANAAEETAVPLQEPANSPAPARLQIRTHQVGAGDTLVAIAEQYHLDLESLYGANPKLTPELYPGDVILIPPGKGVLHKTEDGDTLWQIALVYGAEVAEVIKANGKTEADIAVGEVLFIPGGKLPGGRKSIQVSRGGGYRFLWPAQGELSSDFGYRWGRLHAGVDIANDIGTPIRAAFTGRVAYTGWYSGYGCTIVLDHENGYTTLYGHLQDYIVEEGQYVRMGQPIGYMGNTGNSTGPHLHFEVRREGVPVNPRGLLSN